MSDALLQPLHLSKIARREFAGNTQYRAECTGCLFRSMWTSDRARAEEDASIHGKAMRDKEKAAERKK